MNCSAIFVFLYREYSQLNNYNQSKPKSSTQEGQEVQSDNKTEILKVFFYGDCCGAGYQI